MSKYEFIKKDEDTTILKYKEKEFEIKKDVELQKEMESVNKNAKTKMMLDLTKQGITSKDLIVVKKEGNKVYEDKSNLVEMEKTYVQEASVDLFQNLSKKYFNMSLEELIVDIGLTDEEGTQFGTDFAYALAGKKSPSQKN
ncbi:MAG: hypothetical protein IKE89_03330 [Bacilli bacterium]|nr:hypothetical protein [Bacilli bacterium]MBR2711483.1 hypothetical protein [Bacilli bacterium]